MGTWNIVYNSHIEFKRIEAEFYQKKFIEAKDKSGNKSLSQYGVSVIHPAEVTRIYSEDGFLQIVLAQNVRDNVMDWTVRKHMDASMLKYISRNKLFEGDVLVTRSGANFGQTSVITIEPNYFNLYACADILILKPGIIGGPLLSTFLNTTTGKLLMIRGVYGAGQPHVAPTYISKITFPEFLLEHKIEIEEIIYRSRKLHLESLNLYSQATQILEQELGLDKISFEKPRSYTARFSEVIDFSRFDSEHYQPKYQKYRELIMAYSNGYERLLANVKAIKPDYQLKNHPEKIINYIELSKINAGLGVIENIVSIDKNAAPSRAKRLVKSGDVIASSVVGSVEKSALVSELEDGYIASNGFFQFRSDVYTPEFLLLLVKSQFFKEQLQQQSTGGILSAVPDQNLRYLIIPNVRKEVQDEITDKIKMSHQMNRESKNLLEQAKTRVEELIEQSIEANA